MQIVLTLLSQTWDIFVAYSGNSFYMLLFLVAILYLFLTEKEKGVRVILLYSSICLVGLFFFPVFSYLMICKVFDIEVYYRFLWTLPTALVTAYAGVRLVSRIRSGLWKVVAAMVLMLAIAMGGDYTYDHPTFTKTQNAYKLPQEVVTLCDLMLEGRDGEWVRAVFPQELVSSVRQYSNSIHMPYGREMIIPRWGNYHPLFSAMQAEVIDSSNLTSLARDVYCEFIVLEDNREMTESLATYQFEEFAKIDGYIIYQDTLLENH